MFRGLRIGIVGFALCAVIGGSDHSARAETVIQLGSGASTFGIQFNGTALSTGGPQNTSVEFLDFLNWYPDVPTSTASLTLDGITLSGPALVFGGTSILQQFSGGTLSLHDAVHTLLLSGDLSPSVLTGTAGLANGGLFTTSFSTVTGGAFAAYIDRPSLVFQMHLSNINGGAGLSVGPTAPPVGGELHSFTAGVSANIDGEPIPEPATDALLVILSVLTLTSTHNRRLRCDWRT